MIPRLSKPINSHFSFRDLTFARSGKPDGHRDNGQGLVSRGLAPSTMEAPLVCTLWCMPLEADL